MWARTMAAALLAGSAFAGVCGQIPFERRENQQGVSIGARKRVVPEAMLFAEALVKYGQFQNYLHYWIDRPLFWDRAFRKEKFAFETLESFTVHLREARRYGMNGLGIFGTFGGRLRSFLDSLEWAEKSGLQGLQILPIAFYAESGIKYTPDPTEYVDLIKAAQASAFVPRVDGKVLVSSYNYRMIGTEAQRALHEKIREGVGNSDYLLMGDLEVRALNRLKKSFRRNGRLEEPERRELERLVTEVLDIADGLHLGTNDYRREPEGPYCSRFDLSFFRECLTPVLNDVYARPQYSGKLLGFYILQGYINHMSGMNHGEFGTATLRDTMAAALALNPDYLVFFEWNEVNENTMFQPTVYSGQVVGRLIRYYVDLMRGNPHGTYPGDDTDVPNLVLSHHVTFKPGEKLEFEILNIPCGDPAASHEVQLQLWDSSGKKLVQTPKDRLKTSVLGSITYAMPGEGFRPGSSIVPVLMVDGVRYRGFHPVRCDATSCRNYKEVRGGLRDLFAPEERSFTMKRTGAPGVYSFRTHLSFGEKIASVELVADEDEVAAYDASGEYDTASNDVLRLSFTTRPMSGGSKPLSVRLVDAEGTKFLQQWMANVNPDVITPTGADTYRFHAYYWGQATPYYAIVPKCRSAKAKIEIDAAAAWNGAKATIPVSTVLERGSWAAVLSEENGFRVDVTRVDNLPDIPRRPGASAVDWSGCVRSLDPAPSFHLRVISERGRIWRSAPIMPAAVAESPTVDVDYFGEWERKRLRLAVPASLVPDISYVFSPECGAAMANTWHPKYNATLGGGFTDTGPMSEGRAFEGMERGAFDPKWVETGDGKWALRFDGRDDYVAFPAEAFPLNSFSFEAEFRPEYGEKTMVVFRHCALWRASLSLFIRKGRLYAMWGDRDLDDPKHHTARFETGLPIRNGEWNSLKVTYDFGEIAFTVNGQTKAFPFDRRGYVFRPAIFGGHVVTVDISPDRELDWFKGDLRRLRIRHCAEEKGGR